jgi:hypothetical protein
LFFCKCFLIIRVSRKLEDVAPETHKSDLETTGDARKKVIQRLLEQAAADKLTSSDSTSPRATTNTTLNTEGKLYTIYTIYTIYIILYYTIYNTILYFT